MNDLITASGYFMRTHNFFICCRIWVLTILCLAAMSSASAQSTGPARRVKDINRAVDPSPSADPAGYTLVGNTIFFISADQAHGRELWRSDGTPDSTALVRDIVPGPRSAFELSAPAPLFTANGMLYFSADDGTHGRELWRSDGTPAGTFLVKDVYPGWQDSYIGSMVSINGGLIFTADDSKGPGLWYSDGTSAGTIKLAELHYDSWVFNLNGTVFFKDDSQLWKTDGTPGGTVLVKDLRLVWYARLGYPANLNGTLFFPGDDGNGLALWRSDGTPAGTFAMHELNPAGWSSLEYLTAANGNLFFVGNNQLWKTNGTPGGTLQLKGLTSGYDPQLLPAGNRVFFVVGDQTHGHELWVSDGTLAGTKLVKDVIADPDTYGLFLMTHIQGRVFFGLNTGMHGNQLWISDGTPAGTRLIKTFQTTPFGWHTAFAAINDRLFFTASDDVAGLEVWTSDGTADGTALFKDLNVATGSNPTRLTKLNNKLFFIADDGQAGADLWQSDGTLEGTTRVKDSNPGDADAFISELTNTGTQLFFVSRDSDGRAALWLSNGTTAGTAVIKTFENEYATSGPPYALTNVNGTLFFLSNEIGGMGAPPATALWKSDGTPRGTVPIKMFRTTDDYLEVNHLTNVNGMLFLSVYDNGGDSGIWRSDGTPEGTQEVPFGPASPATELINVNGQAFFVAAAGALWRTDSTSGTTTRIKAPQDSQSIYGLTAVGSTLFFAVNDQHGGAELWKSTGTAAGTVAVKDFMNGTDSARLDALTMVKDRLFFSVNDVDHGHELWQSDGTAAGTVLIKDIAPGEISSHPTAITQLGRSKHVLFTASDGISGAELWYTDGTAEGTRQVQDLALGVVSSSPGAFTVVGSQIFFAAGTPDTGRELWSIDRGMFNAAPVVADIYVRTRQQTPVAAVLTASDADEDPLLYSLVNTSSKGTVSLTNAETGAFTYTPHMGALGLDSFTFKASDEIASSSEATVLVMIQGQGVAYLPSITR